MLDLKPLDAGGVINATFRLAFSNLKKFLKIFILFGVFYVVIYGLYAFAVYYTGGFGNSSSLSNSLITLGLMFIYYILMFFLLVFFYSLFADFYIKAYLQEEWSFKTSRKLVFSKNGTLILAGLLAVLIITGGIFLCLVGSLIFMTFLSFIFPVIIYENKKAGQAINRSFKLVSYSFWRVLGTYVLYFLILIASIIVILGILSIPVILFYNYNKSAFQNISNIMDPNFILPLIIIGIIYLVLYFMYLLIVSALSSSLNIILFFNQKVKHEQFGIENLVESITTENISEL